MTTGYEAVGGEDLLTLRANLVRGIDRFIAHDRAGTADVPSKGDGSATPRQAAWITAGLLVGIDGELVRRGAASVL